MNRGAGHGIEWALPRQYDELARILAAAFHDDPVMLWALGEDRVRPAALKRYFDLIVRLYAARGGLMYRERQGRGAAIWARPDRWHISPLDIARHFTSVLGITGIGGVRRALRLMDAVETLHPRTPHYYLNATGVDESARGLGIGRALLEPVLSRCDEDGMPAYLENSKEANLRFYGANAFEVTGTVPLGPGAPTIWTMWREPRTR